MNVEQITSIILPENELEKRLLSDQDLIQGLTYGKPRRSHPEGQVLYHVRDVLGNIDRFQFLDQRVALRLIALVHDSFKYKVDKSKSKIGENHHATIARRFAEKYIQDAGVLDVIQFHDEAYNAWRKSDEERVRNLISRLGINLILFLQFYKCDNCVKGKTQEHFEWFQKLVRAE